MRLASDTDSATQVSRKWNLAGRRDRCLGLAQRDRNRCPLLCQRLGV